MSPMETATTHEARARNAKAQALAAVLHEHRITPDSLTVVLDLLASQQDDVDLVGAFWAKVAEVATLRGLQGEGVTVHAPGSQATIDAVARILGDLIAHENDQAAIAERRAEGEPMPGDDHITSTGETLGSLRRRSAEAVERGYRDRIATDYGRGRRRPTDSGEYRRTVGQLDPTTAQAFAAFGGSDR